MLRRPIPSSLVWLGMLVALAIVTAIVGGVAIYLETKAMARTRAEAITGGRVRAGEHAILRYGCGSCHVVPGISGANGLTGPDLTGIATRATIAGVLPNRPDAMIRWLLHPQAIRPGSGMPEQGLTAADARDIAAYLYTQD